MGLERVENALEKLAHPERRFPSLHVAGTNGKGSVCAMTAACLSTKYRTGRYTSPHLLRVNERISVGGIDITDEALATRIAEVVDVLSVDHRLTFFEFGTIVAFWHFMKERVDIAVIETGLGGRLDATTACAPALCALTPISFDHTEYLGRSLPEIAREKAGILKPGINAVTSRQPKDALEVLSRRAIELHVTLAVEGCDFEIQSTPFGLTYQRRWQSIDRLEIPLRGVHQHQNLAVALAALEGLNRKQFQLSANEIREGLKQTAWPGRLEVFEKDDARIVLDGAHNLAGVQTLLHALDALYAEQSISLIFGVLGDKDFEAMARVLFPRARALFLTPVSNSRSLAPEHYEALARSLCAHVTLCSSSADALAKARGIAGSEGLVVGAGSLHLIGELRALLVGSGIR